MYDPQRQDGLAEPSSRILNFLDQARGDIQIMVDNENKYRETIRALEGRLGAYDIAFSRYNDESRRLEREKADAEKRIADLENQLGKGHRIIVLIDGDGNIFNPQLIAQGQQGGHLAAQKLLESITDDPSTGLSGVHQHQIWVYVFLNKRGLTEAFGRAGFREAKANFENFIMGFNQAAERFIMVDVGHGKEAADAKIKALLEDDIRLPHTEKLIFAGCHDNGYATTLRSQITTGFKHKLILLQGYAEMALGMGDLDLPSFSIPELFMTQKLPTSNHGSSGSFSANSPLLPAFEPAGLVANAKSPAQQDFDPLAQADVSAPSYSPPTQKYKPPNKRPMTSELDHGSNTVDAKDGSFMPGSPRASFSFVSPKSRRTNQNNQSASKYDPPPCTLHYLATCRHGAECKFGHDYELDPKEIKEMRENAQKIPCMQMNKGETCSWGDDCCYGHSCANGPQCSFFKNGRCKFTGADMHK